MYYIFYTNFVIKLLFLHDVSILSLSPNNFYFSSDVLEKPSVLLGTKG